MWDQCGWQCCAESECICKKVKPPCCWGYYLRLLQFDRDGPWRTTTGSKNLQGFNGPTRHVEPWLLPLPTAIREDLSLSPLEHGGGAGGAGLRLRLVLGFPLLRMLRCCCCCCRCRRRRRRSRRRRRRRGGGGGGGGRTYPSTPMGMAMALDVSLPSIYPLFLVMQGSNLRKTLRFRAVSGEAFGHDERGKQFGSLINL